MRTATLLFACLLAAGSQRASAAEPAPPPINQCRKLPSRKRLVRLNLKPNTDVVDLVLWISSVTCKQFLLPSGLGAGKTVTVIAPQLITLDEAYRLFLDALDSVGLTVYSSGGFLRIIDVAEARKSPIPIVLPARDSLPPREHER